MGASVDGETQGTGRPRGFGPIALAVLVIAVGAVGIVILSSGGSFTLHALFEDSGQLVTGGEVQVAGRSVGSISGISVTPDGLADVTLSVGDSSLTPLHQGTRAIIRALGQAGVANRYVQLVPGPQSAPALRNGAVLPTSQTTGIVDLDAVLDTFDPSTRTSIQQLIAHSAQLFAGSGASYFSHMFAGLDPALRALNGLSGQLGEDRVELTQLVQTGAVAAHAVAIRGGELEQAVSHTASALGAIASERAQLADALRRAPSFLSEATTTLHDVSSTVTAVKPTLAAVVPVAQPLTRFLNQVTPTLDEATPTVRSLVDVLPDLRSSLNGLKPLQKPAVGVLTSTQKATTEAMPILAGVREYGSDFFLGVFNGLAGITTGNYNSTGHYVHLEFVQPYQTLITGDLSKILSSPSLSNSLFAEQTGLTSRCPGGNEPPAPDGSNPWVIPGLCTPSEDTPLSVDFP